MSYFVLWIIEEGEGGPFWEWNNFSCENIYLFIFVFKGTSEKTPEKKSKKRKE